MKVKNFENGQRINQLLLVSQVTKGVTQKGSPYLSITLQDNSGEIDAKLWDLKPFQEEIVKVGKFIQVEADVLQYRQNLQLRILNVSAVENQELNLYDFVQSTKLDLEELKRSINGYLNMIEDPILFDLTKASLDYYGDLFYQYPAATRIHHDFVGGLATHVYGMAKLAVSLCEVYPLYNRDLLLAGVLIHDLGKIEEYDSPILSEYTNEGKLLGHISIMHAHLSRIAIELGVESKEQTILLKHLILSHHGKLDYGSPVVPMVKEAEMLNFIDNIDARSNMFEKIYSNMEEGTFSPRNFALDNRSFYKAKDFK